MFREDLNSPVEGKRVHLLFYFFKYVSSTETFSRHGWDETLAYDCKLEREGTDGLLLNENHKLFSPKITNPPFENRQFLSYFLKRETVSIIIVIMFV